MRILLVAYDFPPNPSPQSLRWAYLVRELVARGHDIQVITVDLPGYGPGGLPELPASVRIKRVYPGLFTALLLRRHKVAGRKSGWSSDVNKAPVTVGAHVDSLNWKGRLAERLKEIISLLLFPDYRAEWFFWARRALVTTLRGFRPDVVVTSHEPACSLPLGLLAKRRGYRWIADLGDPVLASYTPRRWKSRAARLERLVCAEADLVSVTSQLTANLLADRHGLKPGESFVLAQGFDAHYLDSGKRASEIQLESDALELLYTGSFYSFRRADALLDALTKVEGIRLSIATSVVPDYLKDHAARHPSSVRLLGFLDHRTVLSMQRRSDVLVNIANADPVQIPGKVNEYLGAARPILHIHAGVNDATGLLLETLGAGFDCQATSEDLVPMLERLRDLKRKGDLTLPCRDDQAINAYSWQSLAALWEKHASRLTVSHRAAGHH